MKIIDLMSRFKPGLFSLRLTVLAALAGLSLFPLAEVCRGAASPLEVTVVPSIANTNHPELLYWFWTTKTIHNRHYLWDVDNIASHSPFTLVFLTQRHGVSFYDFDKMHSCFAATVRAAHERGLKIGLQLWPRSGPVTVDQAIAIVVDNEATLDADGAATITGTSRHVRHNPRPLQSDLLKVMLFKKTGDGFYDPATLVDFTRQARVIRRTRGSVTVQISAGAKYAGYTAFIMTVHYYNHADLFSDYIEKRFNEALEHYADIPFDGTALDEFGNMHIDPHLNASNPWREWFYGQAFARFFKRQTGQSLDETLFDVCYAPTGHPEVRIRAINEYMDLWRQGPLRIENWFYARSRELFGPQIFAGIHDTYHNALTNDEFWATGINWWAVPRQYGQTDERTIFPERIGIEFGHPEPVMYNQFYDRVAQHIYEEAIYDARFNTRVHYHAYNDSIHHWGVDLEKESLLSAITPIEHKIRLLNQFNGPSVRAPLLIVFGFPALLNWYPDEQARNPYDLNGSLNIEQKAEAIWNAGYVCALVPSYEIDDGKLKLNRHDQIVYGNHTFEKLLFLYPQYSKESTIRFLEQYAERGGKFIMVGTATRDFDGRDVTSRFQVLKREAVATHCDLGDLAKLGLSRNPYTNGCVLEDGSVLMTDLPSVQNQRPVPFAIKIKSHTFTGSYAGVVALKADTHGTVEKFACGDCSGLWRDGKPVLQLPQPADCVLKQDRTNHWNLLLNGNPEATPKVIFVPLSVRSKRVIPRN